MRTSSKQCTPFFKRLFLLLVLAVIVQSCSLNARRPQVEPRQLWQTNFPASMALAGYGMGHRSEDAPAADRTLQTDRRLQCALARKAFGTASSKDNAHLITAIEGATGKAIDDRETATKAIQLIQTGQFYRDIASAAEVTADLFPEIRKSIVSELVEPKRITCAITAPIKDLIDQQTVFGNTLGCVYRSPTANDVGKTARILLGNESIRLAVIAYARANGINLNDSDLDALRETLLDTEDPDLAPLAELGVDRLKEEYGVGRIEAVLTEMDNNQFDCERCQDP